VVGELDILFILADPLANPCKVNKLHTRASEIHLNESQGHQCPLVHSGVT
jgi:hypothetical protein